MDEEIVSCGSGGGSVGPSMPAEDPLDGDHVKSYLGTYGVSANQVEIVSRPQLPPTTPDANVITLFAPGLGTNGLVNVRGSQGVRITTGPPPIPLTSSDSTAGFEVEASEAQSIKISVGLPQVGPTVSIDASGIVVDGGVTMGTITIQSLSEITLQVAEGLASIKLTPAGIVLQGPIIQIN